MTTKFKLFALCGVAAGVMFAGVASAGTIAMERVNHDASLTLVTANAGQNEGAKNFISSMGDRGINFLGNPSMSVEAKTAEFKSLLNESFDMNTIGRFAIGNNWKAATPAQQAEYMKLFNQMIVRVYSKRFSDYKGQKFEVKSSRPEGKDTMVTSYIIPPDGPQVQVDWRVRNKSGSYKVVDIIVEGVSMSQTQRADFASVIQRGGGGIEPLLVHLRGQ